MKKSHPRNLGQRVGRTRRGWIAALTAALVLTLANPVAADEYDPEESIEQMETFVFNKSYYRTLVHIPDQIQIFIKCGKQSLTSKKRLSIISFSLRFH